LENLKEIKIFECDSSEKYYDSINKNKEILGEVYVNTLDQKAIFKPLTLAKFNRDVTKKFFSAITDLNSVDNSKYKDMSFINALRLIELKNLLSKHFNLIRLIKICEEINICFENGCYIATIILTRSLLDHIPPIFGKKTFGEVANNYGSKSFRDVMLHLENSSRKIADLYLHSHIKKHEPLPNETQVNFSQSVDLLLAEIANIIDGNIDIPKTELEPNNNIPKKIPEPKQMIKEESKPTISDIAKEIVKKQDLAIKREEILNSSKSLRQAEIEIIDIFEHLRKKIAELKSNKICFSLDRYNEQPQRLDYYPPLFYTLHSENHSFSIEWDLPLKTDGWEYSLKNAKLLVNLSDGHLTKNIAKAPFYKPTLNGNLYSYAFDLKENGELGWKKEQNNKFYSNESIADECINWILNEMNASMPV